MSTTESDAPVSILRGLAPLVPDLERFYKDVHAHPELSMQETRTAGLAADRLRAAFSGDLDDATDCASLVERHGGRVAVVEGDPRLVKVTTVGDLEHVESLLGGDEE